ncbi:PepSY domain-containing protein [Veillonella sp.]|uniref:PepSY-associated TM helix domain-containing protein n=1 Tax=Veillonella sp. TaxID=1926307 RepID=UPI0025F65A4B|nr:PepSY-associated TM helix domain-containing protein [Veillonella sp.]
MSKIYNIHKWFSIISVLFFLMFCITGLILMFRTELNAWAQGGTSHSSSSMVMTQDEISIFKYADEGALLVKKTYPSKDILNISPAMGNGDILRYRIIDSSATVAPPARMGMGGDYALYNPKTKSLITTHHETLAHPWVRSVLHTLHQLHTRLDLGKTGIYIVTILSFICGLSIISGIFLYAPFRKSFAKSAVLSKYMKLSTLHREFAMVSTVWGFILCITGVWIGGFFIANDSYNADVLYTAKQELSANQSDVLQPSEAISRIMKAYPGRQLISMDYPSKFNDHHYAFYLGAENDDDPAMFLGQPVYANLYTDSSQDMYSTKTIPWYFTGMTTMINLHIHNHNTMELKILWAIWDIVLIIGILSGIMMTIKKKFLKSSDSESKAPTVIKHVWRAPICCSILVLLGLIVPLWSNPITNHIAAICLTVPLIVLFHSLIKGFNH